MRAIIIDKLRHRVARIYAGSGDDLAVDSLLGVTRRRIGVFCKGGESDWMFFDSSKFKTPYGAEYVMVAKPKFGEIRDIPEEIAGVCIANFKEYLHIF